MQKEVTTNLTLAIANLELKQLEVIEKLSEVHDDYIIRCITCPDSLEFLAVNGDWERVTGFNEQACVGMSFNDFIPDNQYAPRNTIIEDDFLSYNCDLITKSGDVVNVDWKTKHFPDIDAAVSIGRVKK